MRWCVFLLALTLSVGRGQTQGELEYEACQQWAKLLPLIAEATTWPAEAAAEKNSVFVFGVFGPEKLVGAFRGLEAKAIHRRTVIVKLCHDLVEVQQCHLVFFSVTEEGTFVKIVDQLKRTAVLTVGDWNAFDHEGGILTLGKKDNRQPKSPPKIHVNLPAVKEARLRMSDDLVNTLQEGR